MQLLLYLFSFILFFATSLQNELDKNKLKYRKTNFRSLFFYWICRNSWNFINTAGRQAGQKIVYLSPPTTFTETESLQNMLLLFAVIFCMSQKVIVLACNLLHNSARTEDADGLL